MTWRDRIEDATREGDIDQLLTAKEAAKLLSVTERMIQDWGRTGKIPRVILGYSTVRYRADDIRTMIRERYQQ